MTKKLFSKPDLQSLTTTQNPHNRATDRLRHALIGSRLIDLFPGKLIYGWWIPFERFIDKAPVPWHERVAPLCVFKPDAVGAWSAVAVDRGYHKTAEFTAVLQRAIFAAGGDAAYPSNAQREEGFLSEPRPIYPPRSRFLRD